MLRSDSRGGSGGWVVDFGISEFEGMWIGLVCGSDLCVDWRCKTVNWRRKTHRGSAFGSVIKLP